VRFSWVLISALLVSLCAGARADQTYSFHEKVSSGQNIPEMMTCSSHTKSTTNTNGKPQTTESDQVQMLKAVVTVLEAKDGSATAIRADVDPSSYDTDRENGGAATKTPCSFAGHVVTLRRHPDESISNDFPGDADPTDLDNLEGMLNPDEDFFPDAPVAVGDVWDVSDKLSKHSDLGPDDKLLAKCRLDWVRQINGKQFAQISCSCGTIRFEDDNVEDDIESSMKLLVDMAAGAIVSGDQTGVIRFASPKSDATQRYGINEFTFHGEVVGAVPTTQPTTKP
jgi:hypothetical protein